MTVVLTMGTFDLFHRGHLNLLMRASKLGDRLVVGVSSDSFNMEKKNRKPVYPQEDRMAILLALECVDEVFLEEHIQKDDYVKKYNADLLVMGDDWKGKFDAAPCKVKYLERTPVISTTYLLEQIKLLKEQQADC